MKKYKIVIIWWTWKFWQLWQKYFENKWHEVIISSRKTKIKPKDAIKLGDIIIFSVSIRHTIQVMRDLIPYIEVDKLVMDFTWIKKEATKELTKYTLWEVVATHPMFGPWVKSIKNQNIVYDPIKFWKKWKYIFNIWKNDWANLIKLKSKKHDEIVAILQSSVHFINLLIWHILKKTGISLKDFIKISTPNSRMQIFILSRFLNQNASLYTDMQMFNTVYKDKIIPEIKKFTEKLNFIINNSQNKKFEKEFNNIKKFIWQDFIDASMKISSKFDEESKKIYK